MPVQLSSFRLKSCAAIVGVSTLFLSGLSAHAEQKDKPIKIEELHFGEVLYHYFLKQYPESLTRIQAGIEQNTIQKHAQDALLLDANISVNYGLFDHAQQLLNQLLGESLSEQKKQIAWLYLAKQALAHDLPEQAKQALKQNSNLLTTSQQAEKLYIASQVLISNSDIDFILSQVAKNSDSEWRPYTLFNIAVAAVNQGRIQDATTILERQLAIETEDEVQRVLKDRAALALGLLYLQQKQFNQAETAFQKIQLKSPLAQQAFYTFGWGLMQDGKVERARAPWNWLIQNRHISSWSWYSYLALAQSYEDKDAPEPESALTIYKAATKRYLSDKKLLALLSKELNFENVEILIHADRPLGDKLGEIQLAFSEVLSDEALQTSLTNLKQLADLQDQLIDKKRRIEAIQDTLAYRKERRQQRLATYQQNAQPELFQQIEQRIVLTEQTLEQTRIPSEEYLLATTEQKEWKEQINNAKALEAWLRQFNDTGQALEKIRRVEGVLEWEISQSFPTQRWETQKALSETKAVYDELKNRQKRLDGLLVAKTVRPEEEAKLAQLLKQTDESLSHSTQQVTQLKQQIVNQIQNAVLQKNHLLDGLYAQARLAITRLSDDAFRKSQLPEQSAPDDQESNIDANSIEDGTESRNDSILPLNNPLHSSTTQNAMNFLNSELDS